MAHQALKMAAVVSAMILGGGFIWYQAMYAPKQREEIAKQRAAGAARQNETPPQIGRAEDQREIISSSKVRVLKITPEDLEKFGKNEPQSASKQETIMSGSKSFGGGTQIMPGPLSGDGDKKPSPAPTRATDQKAIMSSSKDEIMDIPIYAGTSTAPATQPATRPAAK
jgi:hypothetical protein